VDIVITDHPERGRYEAYAGSELAGFLQHKSRPDGIALVHTEVLPEFEGKGIGSALVKYAVEDVRAKGAKIIPDCPFITRFIRRHPEYLDAVAERCRASVTPS
jgi:predicted GNAT family acetyltransferase